MIGRYGMDDLNRFLYWSFIVLFILELIIPVRPVKSVLSWVTLSTSKGKTMVSHPLGLCLVL